MSEIIENYTVELNELAGQIGDGNALRNWHARYHALLGKRDTAGLRDHIVSKVALIGTEVAEAIEEIRNGFEFDETYYTINGVRVYKVNDFSGADWTTHPSGTTLDEGNGIPQTWTGVLAKPEGLPAELADILIRTLDLFDMLRIDVEAATSEKLRYNDSRARMHGGKKL